MLEYACGSAYPNSEAYLDMRALLEILDGPLAGRMIEIPPGQPLSVGRTAKSQLMLPYDNFISGLHFQIDKGPEGLVLRDCNSSNGTWVNGQRVLERGLNDGDQIAAGQTRFRIHIKSEAEAGVAGRRTTTVLLSAPSIEELEKHAPSAAPAAYLTTRPLEAHQEAILRLLERLATPVYALVDNAAEPRALQWLTASGEIYQHVWDEQQVQGGLAPAFCLTHLPPTARLMRLLVEHGWGSNWMLLLTSTRPFVEIRQHLRQFTLLRTVDGRAFTFRLTYPALLHAFLTTLTAAEAQQFFGPIERFLTPDLAHADQLAELRLTPQGLTRNLYSLTA